MKNRAEALHALRPGRAAGLPAPPPRPIIVLPDLEPHVMGDDNDVESDATSPGMALEAAVTRSEPQAPSSTGDGVAPVGKASFSFAALVDHPEETCKAMTDARALQPAKPLNVDITPGVADAFNERCRTLRVKKKDVVEVLLRAWLESSPEPRP